MCRIHIIFSLFIISFILSFQNTFAQANLDKQLAIASGQMYQSRNTNFILAEAVRDNLVPVSTAFKIVYEAEHFTLNGKPLPEPLKTKYENLMRDFNITYHNTNVYVSIESDGITLNDLLDPKSHTRHPITAAEIEQKIKEGTKGSN